MRILVADDDKVVSLHICAILRDRGYTPMPVFDSMQVIQAAMRAPKPEGIILDLGMPGGKGLQTLTRLKSLAKTATIPIIVVSGTTDPNEIRAVTELGAVAFLPKPVDATALCAAVEGAVGVPTPRLPST